MRAELSWAWRYIKSDLRFTAVAVLSLGLGISAATAIFTVVYSVLIAQLPFPDSERLIVVDETDRGRPVTASPQRFRDWLRAPSIAHVMAYYSEDLSVRIGAAPERIAGIRTFGDPLETLNVQPAAGRRFTEAEKRGTGPRIAVITNALWRTRFGAEPGVVGRHITVNGEPCEIVGILGPGVRLDDAEIISPESNQDLPRSARFLVQIARLRPGASLASARTELRVVATQLQREYPATDADVGASASLLRDSIGSSARTPLLTLLGAVGFVLLIASVNIAGLSVSRIASRGRELAIRFALGATRGRVIVMVLLESAMLALAGGILGVIACGWELDLIRSVAASELPRMDEVRMNWLVLAASFLVTAASAIVAGLLPAWSAARQNTAPALRGGGRSTSATHRTQASMVVVQIAASVVLLIAGGLLFQSLLNLEHRPLGFAPQRMLTFRLSLPWQTKEADVSAKYQMLLQRLRAIPGVRDAALVDRLPLAGPTVSADADVEGRGSRPEQAVQLEQRSVSANYHRLMAVPLLAGRYLEEEDANRKATVINASAASTLFPDGQALGKHLGLRWKTAKGTSVNRFEVVGIVADIPNYTRDLSGSPAMYVPFQQAFWPAATFVVQSSLPPISLADAARRVAAGVDPSNAIEAVQPLDRFLESRTRTERLQASLIACFGIVAMLLAAIGVYGLAARRAADRRREMAIRIALGATSRDVIGASVGSTVRLAACGGVAGIICGAVAVRLFGATLYGVQAIHLPTYALSAGALVAVAILASWRPAAQATRLQPVEVLKED